MTTGFLYRCPLDRHAQSRLQIEFMFALMNHVDPIDAVQAFVSGISNEIGAGALELDFLEEASATDDRSMRIALTVAGLPDLVATGEGLKDDRPWLIELVQFIEKALHHAQGAVATAAPGLAAPASIIARDLHDGVAQELAYLSMQTNLLLRRIMQPEQARPLAEELRAGLSRTQRRVRELISHARLTLSGKSLRESLTELVQELSPRCDIVFNLDNRLPDNLLGEEVEHQIFHIVRESLVNAIRHSRARTVSVELRTDSHCAVLLTVEDDGVGGAADLRSSGHYGISIMRERASSIGARMEIGECEAAGTRLRLKLPVATPQVRP